MGTVWTPHGAGAGAESRAGGAVPEARLKATNSAVCGTTKSSGG